LRKKEKNSRFQKCKKKKRGEPGPFLGEEVLFVNGGGGKAKNLVLSGKGRGGI